MEYYFPYGFPPGFKPHEQLSRDARVFNWQEPPPDRPKAIRVVGGEMTKLRSKIYHLLNRNTELEKQNTDLEKENRELSAKNELLEKMIATYKPMVKEMEGKIAFQASELRKAKERDEKKGGGTEKVERNKKVVVKEEEEISIKGRASVVNEEEGGVSGKEAAATTEKLSKKQKKKQKEKEKKEFKLGSYEVVREDGGRKDDKRVTAEAKVEGLSSKEQVAETEELGSREKEVANDAQVKDDGKDESTVVRDDSTESRKRSFTEDDVDWDFSDDEPESKKQKN